MKAIPFLLTLAVLLPSSVTLGGSQVPEPPETWDRTYVLVMEGATFNGLPAPYAPVLEAAVGEVMRIIVHVPELVGEAHTFHMHGHPWPEPSPHQTTPRPLPPVWTGDFIDAVLLQPGQFHDFTVEAGLGDPDLVGDWFYHCHMESHFKEGMWGIVRVLPYSVIPAGNAGAITLQMHQMGNPVEDATVQVTLDDVPIGARLSHQGDGHYVLEPALPAGATGRLVVTTQAGLGESVARMDIGADGVVLPVRDVLPPQGLADPEVQRIVDDLPDLTLA